MDIHSTALADPDAQTLTQELLEGMRRTPQVRDPPCAGLSQEELAERFHIPLGSFSRLGMGRKDPDAVARAYLAVMAGNGVR